MDAKDVRGRTSLKLVGNHGVLGDVNFVVYGQLVFFRTPENPRPHNQCP